MASGAPAPAAVTIARAAVAVAVVALAACANTSNNAPDAGAAAAPDAGAGGSGGGAAYLWYAGAALGAFSKPQTAASNDDGPALIVLPHVSANNFHDLAFDAGGNLWTIPISGDEIIRLPAAQLPLHVPEPDLVLTGPGLVSPHSLVFDASGNLWVMSYDGTSPSVATIVRLDDPRGLAGAQTVSPSLTIGPGATAAGAAQFSQGNTIAFDRSNNLWFASIATVIRLDQPASLQGTVTAAPNAVISTGETYDSIAFDATGALWVTAATTQYLALRFDDPGSLVGAVSPSPSARVSIPVGDALFAGGMAFDAGGALWIGMSDQIVEIASPAMFVGAVTPTPQVVLGGQVFPDLASKLVFLPTPAGLPLYAP